MNPRKDIEPPAIVRQAEAIDADAAYINPGVPGITPIGVTTP
jgi:hypothetical protein